MVAAQKAQEDVANRKRTAAREYRVGDKVWLSLKNFNLDVPSKKLAWLHAKYTVTKVISSHVYELDVPQGVWPRFHVDLIRPAYEDPLPSQKTTDYQPPPVFTDISNPDNNEWEVESISRARTKRRGRGSYRQVLVKWRGYAEPTWEPLENLKGTQALDEFEAKYGPATDFDGEKPASQRRTRLAEARKEHK
jgi:hypothetical protein